MLVRYERTDCIKVEEEGSTQTPLVWTESVGAGEEEGEEGGGSFSKALVNENRYYSDDEREDGQIACQYKYFHRTLLQYTVQSI